MDGLTRINVSTIYEEGLELRNQRGKEPHNNSTANVPK